MRKFLILFLITVWSFSFSQTIKTDLIYKINEPTKKTDKPAPLLIFLHGYGSSETDLFDIAKSLDARFMFISLRGPIALKDAGFAWYELEFLPEQKFKYDYAKAKESRIKILSFISNACKAYKLDSNNVFVMGFSQGAIMGYDLALAAPKKIKGVLALSGKMMEESKNLKTDWAKAAKTKYFIAHGNADNVIKISEADSAVSFLKSKKVKDVKFNNYEMVHTVNGKELNDIKSWLKKAIDPPEKEPLKTNTTNTISPKK
ncbi:MAG: dienelactone hydrolase family protein [Bacteroidetes bacterium]|nr:dienelactone hydrolase family protein [Bacteroidota bacterium]